MQWSLRRKTRRSFQRQQAAFVDNCQATRVRGPWIARADEGLIDDLLQCDRVNACAPIRHRQRCVTRWPRRIDHFNF